MPLGIYLLDGDAVLQPAQFCKAGEVSVAFVLSEAQASSSNLAIAPCTFAADSGAKLEVEVMAPDAPSAALELSASSGVDPRTLLTEGSKGAAGPADKGRRRASMPEMASKGVGKGAGAKPKRIGLKAASMPGSMMGAKTDVMGISDLYGSLE